MSVEPRATYHHGALREALLEGAAAMLAERGPDRFSVSELARRLGVSTAAPYRHFADRDALLDALSDDGYRIFGAGLDSALASTTDPRERLQRIGVAYLEFAAAHPAVFDLMFRDRDGRPHEVGPPTFLPLVEVVEAAQASGVLPMDIPVPALARTIWAVVHGLATLSAKGGLSKLSLDDDRERLVADAMALVTR